MSVRLAFISILMCSNALAAYGQTSLRSPSPTEETYLATRDAGIAKIKARDAANANTTDAQVKEESRILRDLGIKLRRAIGPVAVAGFPAAGTSNIETLSSGDVGFGALDATVFRSRDGKTDLFVTTDGLFTKWLKSHEKWWDGEPLPQGPAEALRREAFYTQAISADAAVILYGALPIETPPAAALAVAQLESSSQDQPPPVPDRVLVSVLTAGKVFIVVAPLTKAFVMAAPCDSIQAEGARRVQQASDVQTKAVADGKPDDGKAMDEFLRLQKEAAEANLRCFVEHADSQPAFAAATKRAQILIEMVSKR